MKKHLYLAALLVITSFTLSSCGSDEPKDKVSATATYNLSFSQDLLDACNVFITYKAENGRNVMEPIITECIFESITWLRNVMAILR